LTLVGRAFRSMAGQLPAPLTRPLGQPAAVFFHGVERDIFDPSLQDNHHAIEDFHAIASALKANFDVAPLSELDDAIANPKRHRRTVFLMSDDGYANTLHTAADVLQDLCLPWTVFLSTEHIDTGGRNPMFLSRAFLQHAPDGVYELPHLPNPVRLNGSRGATAVAVVGEFRRLPAQHAKEVAATMMAVLADSAPDLLAGYSSEAFLHWDGVRALARRNVTIGAHAHWHWALHEKEDVDTVRLQAEEPRRRIEAELRAPCRYFAYPFGNRNDVSGAAWRAVRDAGYSHAFTTMSGTLNASQNPWLLPRYGLALRERNLPAMLPLLRLANRRLTRWQASLN
jgi:peptidoglycan/xylan/chitin deacetylase (PgdA/CDA1 family)